MTSIVDLKRPSAPSGDLENGTVESTEPEYEFHLTQLEDSKYSGFLEFKSKIDGEQYVAQKTRNMTYAPLIPFTVIKDLLIFSRINFYLSPFADNTSQGAFAAAFSFAIFGLFLQMSLILSYFLLYSGAKKGSIAYKFADFVIVKSLFGFIKCFSVLMTTLAAALTIIGRVNYGHCDTNTGVWDMTRCNSAGPNELPQDLLFIIFFNPVAVIVAVKGISKPGLSLIIGVCIATTIAGIVYHRNNVWNMIIPLYFILIIHYEVERSKISMFLQGKIAYEAEKVKRLEAEKEAHRQEQLRIEIEKESAEYERIVHERRKLMEMRSSRLLTLPVHKAVLAEHLDAEEILSLLLDRSTRHTALCKDFEGKTAFDHAIEKVGMDSRVLVSLLEMCLPIDIITKETVNGSEHNYAWTNTVQNDKNEYLVGQILDRHPPLAMSLMMACDEHGRHAVNIASAKCKKLILESVYFLRRYEITTSDRPHYMSPTCVVHLAMDHGSSGTGETVNVALKFMRNRDEFLREVTVREEGSFDDQYVMGILRVHDSDCDDIVKVEMCHKGFDTTPYVLVMPAGDRVLFDILSKERIGENKDRLRSTCLDIANAVGHLHEHHIMHGDLKPQNIIRMNHRLMLIDLDASAVFQHHVNEIPVDSNSNSIDKEGFEAYSDLKSGLKFSSGYAPPEMIDPTIVDAQFSHFLSHVSMSMSMDGNDGNISAFKVIGMEFINRNLRASASYDLWSLGVVLFHILTNCSLFHVDGDGNMVSIEDMKLLAEWSIETKMDKLRLIGDKYARNLVSLLLSKDPSKRPSIPQLLSHPFCTGKTAVRLPGEKAEFDIFISYRVASDASAAEMLYHQLRAAGLKVWWDVKCLVPGELWEQGFCKGLVKSRIFVPIISRDALKHPTSIRQNIEKLDAKSPCDNVLLEYRLALELVDRGMIDKIYPVFIGDKDAGREAIEKYTFGGGGAGGGCFPNCPNVVVESLELKFQEHLYEQGLGLPLSDNLSVSRILEKLTQYQGGFVIGDPYCSLGELVAVLKSADTQISFDI